MEPYYDRDGITLYNADCREIIPELGSFDMILADPPYAETNLEWDIWPVGGLIWYGSHYCLMVPCGASGRCVCGGVIKCVLNLKTGLCHRT